MKKKVFSVALLASLLVVMLVSAAMAVRENAISFRFVNQSRKTVSRIYVHDWRVSSNDWDADDIVWDERIYPGESAEIGFIIEGGRVPKFDIMLRFTDGSRDVYEDFDFANIERLVLRRGAVLEVE